MEDLVAFSQKLREIVLKQSKQANVGHIGSALSVADILSVLYNGILKVEDPQSPQRDRFILSKGHAALALYATLHLKGFISEEEINTYCQNGTFLGVHPESSVSGIDFSTGSLGQGLSMGVGAALAAKAKKLDYRTFVLISDAECNEGSVWEALMFSAQHQLSNLVVIIDFNGQQALGHTEDILNLENIDQRLKSFGWDVETVDGHNVSALSQSLSQVGSSQAPKAIIAETVCGKGVSYMEGKVKWHYWPMSDEQYQMALEEVHQK